MSDRTLADVNRELVELADRSRALQVERAQLLSEHADANHRRTMRLLEALLCGHESRTRFVGCGGRAYWICDACEQVVEKAEREPATTVIVNVATPESIAQLLDTPGGEAAILSVLQARRPRPPESAPAPAPALDLLDPPQGVERIDKVALFALPEYSFSLPTGTTIGKRWRALRGARWWIGEYVPCEKPGHVGIVWKVAELVEVPPCAAPCSPEHLEPGGMVIGPDGGAYPAAAPKFRKVGDCIAKFDNVAPRFGADPTVHQLGRDPVADAELAREFRLPGSREHATYEHGFAKSGTIEPASEPEPAPPPVGRSPDDMPF